MSPFEEVFKAFDEEEEHLRWDAVAYHNHAKHMELNKLLKEELYWRKDHNINVVSSIIGQQGSGKSLSFISFALFISEVYGIPFTIDNICFRFSELDQLLNKATERQTFLRDETEHQRVGLNSEIIRQGIRDYEDILRIKQINLLTCSIDLQGRSHNFYFKTHRAIYPPNSDKATNFITILKTPRDNGSNFTEFVSRGLVSFKPSTDSKFLEEYEKKKLENISNFQAKYGNNASFIDEDVVSFLAENEKEFITTTKEGLIEPVSKMAMLNNFRNKGTVKYSLYVAEMVCEQMKKLINNKFREHNEKVLMELHSQKEEKLKKLESLKERKLLLEEQKMKLKLLRTNQKE
jgi:hypothetical protein